MQYNRTENYNYFKILGLKIHSCNHSSDCCYKSTPGNHGQILLCPLDILTSIMQPTFLFLLLLLYVFFLMKEKEKIKNLSTNF